jgi:hypothetical protein
MSNVKTRYVKHIGEYCIGGTVNVLTISKNKVIESITLNIYQYKTKVIVVSKVFYSYDKLQEYLVMDATTWYYGELVVNEAKQLHKEAEENLGSNF